MESIGPTRFGLDGKGLGPLTISSRIRGQGMMGMKQTRLGGLPPTRPGSRPEWCAHLPTIFLCTKKKIESIGAQETRRSGGHLPTLLDDEFVKSFTASYSYESHGACLEELKQGASKLLDSTEYIRDRLELINTMQQLGVAYHFDNEIKHILGQLADSSNIITSDIATVALQFRLLRQNGFFVSTDLFNEFMERDGKFMESLGEDMIGILGLYNASFLGMPDEHVLDEAYNFSVKHLKSLRGKMAQQVQQSLEMPLHWSLSLAEARSFIDIYQRDDKKNLVLLELAKLNYNILQSVYLKELQLLVEWWKDLNFAEKLPFARDRLIECYVFAMGCSPEVQFSKLRKTVAKFAYLATFHDDMYDTHGLLDELQKYTNAINRLDLEPIEELPEYMKVLYLATYNHVREVVHDALEDYGIDILHHVRKQWVGYTKANMQEAQWIFNGYNPTADEYLRNAGMTIGTQPVVAYGILAIAGHPLNEYLSEVVEHSFDSEIVYILGSIVRLINDLNTDKVEMERGEALNYMYCLMTHEGVSEDEAIDKVKGLIRSLWKKLNEALLKCSLHAPRFANYIVAATRSTHRIYQYGDWFGIQSKVNKEYMMSSLFEPIPID